ncbi:alpha/beta fold hydrolase [Nakamurella sp. YIM 132087]|uniref:Alpha/beta fold hydrolase n=2 Tax=Nakamurella alba TaxID=2665158 RepID=A0A7K1FSE5_9ACTN|nr:alpha/beta fold hydrolase [Nakamurella alba]
MALTGPFDHDGAPAVAAFPAHAVDETLRHRTVSANGIRFHVVESGTGPLVLLLHGFGQYWLNWRHQLPALAAAGFRAVAVDLRGSGGSDKPPRGYDAFTLSADIAGLVRALGERKATLIGQGYGGVLAFDTAIIHPTVVEKVVAIAAPSPMRTAKVHRVRTDPYRRLLHFAAMPFVPDRRLARADGSMLERIVRSQAGAAWKASADFRETIAAMRRAIVVPGAAKGAIEKLRWVARSPWRADGLRHREALEQPVQAPVLHIAGDADRFTPTAALADAAGHCAGGYRREVVPGVGHYPAEEAPEVVNALIVDFLRS